MTEARDCCARLAAGTGKPEAIEAAIRDLEILIQRNAGNPGLKVELANIFAGKGDLLRARALYREVIAKEKNLSAYLALAEIARQEKNYKEMLEFANECIRLDEANPRAKILRAAALTGTGDYAEARIEFRSILREHVQDRDASLQLALVEIHQGRTVKRNPSLSACMRPGTSMPV